MATVNKPYINQINAKVEGMEGIACQFNGESMPNNASSVDFKIDGYKRVTVNKIFTWDKADYTILLAVLNMVDNNEMSRFEFREWLVSLDKSMTDCTMYREYIDGVTLVKRRYAKDNDRLFRIDLKASINLAMKRYSFSNVLIEDLESEIDLKNTRLINGYYVTPCAIACVLRQVFRSIGNKNKTWLLNQLGIKDNRNAIMKTCDDIASLYIQGDEETFWNKYEIFQKAAIVEV